MVVSNSKYELRKTAGLKNKGYLAGMDPDDLFEYAETMPETAFNIPRYTELTYLDLSELEE